MRLSFHTCSMTAHEIAVVREKRASVKRVPWVAWLICVLIIPWIFMALTGRHMAPPFSGSAINTVIWYPLPLLIVAASKQLLAFFLAPLQFPIYGAVVCLLARRRPCVRAGLIVLMIHIMSALITAIVLRRSL
jgi:hypothetical protein